MKVKKIVIVGGGSAGWMTAATLIKKFPNHNISLIEPSDIKTVGVGESTLGGIRRWTRFIGLDEKDFFPATDASLKLSIKFTDFYKKDDGGFHYPFGKPFLDGPGTPSFNHWHFKKFFYPETPKEDFVRCLFPAAALFENNRFNLNYFKDFDNFNPGNDVAYHFDADKFGYWLKENYCKPKGVMHIEGKVVDIKTNEDGIDYLTLDNGNNITADLFVDCTGFKSLLLAGALEEPFDSMAEMLPNNRAWATRIPYRNKDKELEGFTNSTAIENGWCWNIPSWERLGAGYVYSDKFATPEEALEQFKNYLMSDKIVIPRTKEEVDSLEFRDIRFRVGIHNRTFVKNVVAIGLSAGFIEPLESNGLYTVHEFLFKLIDTLDRGNEISEFDRDMYNASTQVMFKGFAKFVALHYALSHRDDTEYWKAINRKHFADKADEMTSPYIDKSSSFYDMSIRYLDGWGHPIGNAGITYIATGMNVNMVNEQRAVQVQYEEPDISILEKTNEYCRVWEERKAKWQRNAMNSPLLSEYLYHAFYKKDEDVDKEDMIQF
jgi:tryptophan halogenase